MTEVINSLKVQTLWVAPHTAFEGLSTPVVGRLEDLHKGLRGIHAGLWVNTKPGKPRFNSKEHPDHKVTVYQLNYNSRVKKEEVVAVVEAFGFKVVPQLEPVLVA